ncbi:MAG: GNAT family N-acetyltransferase [Ilumatobacteraceae bacterium]
MSPDEPPRWQPITLPPADQHRWERAATIGFGETEPVDPWSVEQIEGLGRRAWVVEDRNTIIGTSADLTWRLTMPGGAGTPAGAVVAVTTRATHRRRGVLSALMGAQLGAMAAEGLAAAVLTASEGTIYGRFGFGIAAYQHHLVAPTGGHGLDHVPLGHIDLDEASACRDAIVAYRRRIEAHRPGTLERPELWWDRLVLGKRRSFEGGGPQFVSLHRDATGSVDGYALWRLEGDWGGRTVVVRELHTLKPRVELALFRHCAEIDLSSSVRWDTAPADSPVLAATSDPRNCRIDGRRDQLWLCPLDPAALLAARTYEAPIDLTLRIEGQAAGWSAPTVTVRLRALPGEPAAATVLDASAPAQPGPDLTCDRATLGMAILGTTPWRTLVAAGRVTVGNTGVVPILDAAFAAHPAPNSQDYF